MTDVALTEMTAMHRQVFDAIEGLMWDGGATDAEILEALRGTHAGCSCWINIATTALMIWGYIDAYEDEYGDMIYTTNGVAY